MCSADPSALWMTASTVIAPHYPDGIDGHRTLGDKTGLAGKRDMAQEEDFRTGLSVCLSVCKDALCDLWASLHQNEFKDNTWHETVVLGQVFFFYYNRKKQPWLNSYWRHTGSFHHICILQTTNKKAVCLGFSSKKKKHSLLQSPVGVPSKTSFIVKLAMNIDSTHPFK